MATPFDRLMDTIRPHLPGSVDQAIRQELFSACQEFFGESNVWREDCELVLKLDEDEAEIMPYTGQIKRLLYVTDSDGAPVRGVIMPDTVQGSLKFPYKANGDSNYTATVSITPSDPISRDAFPIVPYDLVTKYWREIMWTLLAQMMVQPNKPYTDLSMAALYNSKSKGGIARARKTTNAGNTQNSQTWMFPQSFNRRK